jgi:anaerobic magnesium-protoporphyrin IX monomethyl ester cyclase
MATTSCDVLLVNAPSAYRLPASSRKDHVGIGYLTSVLRANGFSVQVLDTPMLEWGVARTLEEILPIQARVVGLSALQAQADGVVGLAKGIRASGSTVPIVLGGQFPTFCYDRLLADFPEVDAVVRGEGEVPFLEMVQRIAAGEDWRDIAGVAHLAGGQPVANPTPDLIADLDALPFPARDTLPAVRSVGAMVSVSSSRGCPCRCVFCSIPNFYRLSKGPIWRMRSPESVLEEIKSLVADHDVHRFIFVDDNFIGVGERGKERARDIAERIIREKLEVEFLLSCRVTDVDEELFTLLKRAGLVSVGLGVESGNQRQLDTYNKGTTVEDNKRAIHTLRKIGVDPGMGFIMADPYFTPEELLANLQFLKEVGVSLSDLTFPLGELWVFDGTDILPKLKAEGRLRGNYLKGYSYVPAHKRFYSLYRAASWMRDRLRPAPRRAV